MASTNVKLSIVFADISGSTRLYETLGDEIARELVSQCLNLMTEQITRYDGRVVKTIGDEIMCTFPSADQAVESAIGMQESVTEDLPALVPDTPSTPTIRVGLHYGPVLLENGDVFGDAVNTAARMAGLAKGGQIITTRDTAESLSPLLQACTRHLDRITVKGKADDIDIFEVIWQPDDITRIATSIIYSETREATLLLRYREHEIRLNRNMGTVILGRGATADLTVNDSRVSREHARIRFQRGKFLLKDQSTNGTYLITSEGSLYLRREETPLTGEGKIFLGREPGTATEVVTFSCD